MRVTWYGQSSFALDASIAVFLDPFGDMSSLRHRGLLWEYPPLPAGISADLLLVTHEHADHNAVEVVGGRPMTIRSLAGTFESAAGRVVGIASEHDAAAGTIRGANVIYRFTVDDLAICHLGDFGQGAMRSEQLAAIGAVDLLFVPVGGSATVDGSSAAALVHELSPRWVVPMHYRTPAIGFLEPVHRFLEAMDGHEVLEISQSSFETGDLPHADGPVVLLPQPPAVVGNAGSPDRETQSDKE